MSDERQMKYGTLLLATVGKQDREADKKPAKPGTPKSVASRVALLTELSKNEA